MKKVIVEDDETISYATEGWGRHCKSLHLVTVQL